MFGINGAAAQIFYSQTPETFKAMQRLVMALDEFYKGFEKKSRFGFGQGKSLQLMEKIAVHIGVTITAMRWDGIIAPQSSAAEVHVELQERLNRFFEAFPTWAGAQIAAMVAFNDEGSWKIVQAHVEHSELSRVDRERQSTGKAPSEYAHRAGVRFDDLTEVQREQARKLFPGVSAKQPYRYVIENDEVHHRFKTSIYY